MLSFNNAQLLNAVMYSEVDKAAQVVVCGLKAFRIPKCSSYILLQRLHGRIVVCMSSCRESMGLSKVSGVAKRLQATRNNSVHMIYCIMEGVSNTRL